MKKYWLLFFLISWLNLSAQSIQSPSDFLGYSLGEKFSQHHRVLEYFRYLSSVSKNIRLQDYGSTYEGRPLLLAFISSDKNIASLDDIRKNNFRLAGMEKGTATSGPAIVWLSYNVHGNEPASTEAAMQTAFELLDPASLSSKKWLANTVVVIDPCLNPDGRERYVNFFNSVGNIVPDVHPQTREHLEPWPGGRSNHYYFDLNRDWAWQTQIETQQRMLVYNNWLPQIHVDFHEQGYNEPYYFAPAAEPLHEDISLWQREFQTLIGKNNAKYFDKKGWLYFTRERFDLLYPSYGDTYPTYNGAVGMTYEQGGSARAGLAVMTDAGDTLTFKERITHHVASGLATIETSAANSSKLLEEFRRYFEVSRSDPSGVYKSYVVKADNSGRLNHLATLLRRNGIEFGFGSAKSANGFNYFTRKSESFNINRNDMVISAYQPKSVLLKVLFEPSTFVSDSVTYDITAWSLPYAYGLPAFACKSALKPSFAFPEPPASEPAGANPVAFVANWESMNDVRFLALLLTNDVRVRFSEKAFESGGRKFNTGSLIVTRSDNERRNTTFESMIKSLAAQSDVNLYPISSGFTDKGADLGSEKVRPIRKVRIGVVFGDESSPQAFGEIWHYFERQVSYPFSALRFQNLKHLNLTDFNVLIFPDGNYADLPLEKLQGWVNEGGKLIIMGEALSQLAGKKGFFLSSREDEKSDTSRYPYHNLVRYGDRERVSIGNTIPGAIYRVDLDNTHPLAFGFPSFYHTLKLDAGVYNFLEGGWNVGTIRRDNYVTGFAGNQIRRKLVDGMLFGVQEMGSGSIVYITEDPLFRGFWEGGKLLFSNAVFMVGQ